MDIHSRKVDIAGLDGDVLIALSEMHNLGSLTDSERVARIKNMSAYEVLDSYLRYEGIVGYTDRLWRVFESIQEAAQ